MSNRLVLPSDIANQLHANPIGRVAAILSGDKIGLENGETVRLAGIEAPRIGTADRRPDPQASEASRALGESVLGREIRLAPAADPRDRWGRILAHVVTIPDPGGPEVWVQGHLLASGLARVRTWPNAEAGARTLLDIERTARAADRGIWAEPFFRIRNPDETWNDLDTVQIVEGRVVDAATVRGTGYLNFGRNWRQDFTFRIKPEARRAFRKAGLEVEGLVRRRVRGRGWVFPLNGPMIDLTHVAQLEVLEE